MKITVLEYLCCGGLVGLPGSNETERLPDPQMQALLHEGLEMWRAVVFDLISCGHEVTSVVDPQLRELNGEDIQVLKDHGLCLVEFDSARRLEENWSSAALGADRVLVIAPEIDNILESLIAHLRGQRFVVIAPSLHFLRIASDKWQTFQSLGAHVEQPTTWLASDISQVQEFPRSSGLGFVLKPRDGAGGGGCSRYETWEQTLEAVLGLASPDRWIVQEWNVGRHCSVAMLVEDSGALRVLGATEQLLKFDENGFHYLGARGPLTHQETQGIENWCQQVLALIPGAFGWIGIDYLALEHEPTQDSRPTESSRRERVDEGRSELYCSNRMLIEINPRLTTSYLLYRQVYGPGLSQGLVGLETDLHALRETNPGATLEYLVDRPKC
ncbi:MAG: ATP-grasp domain-containing protein [Pirellula sp.]|jgi:predicted ATP-grasp superfamily ATP-dependent carboligase|nr:ATP-grasp domain-containing protein [Pirellula sp.]